MNMDQVKAAKRLIEQRDEALGYLAKWSGWKHDNNPLLVGCIMEKRNQYRQLPELSNDNAMNQAIIKAIRQEYEDRLKRINADLRDLGVEVTDPPVFEDAP